MSIKKFIRKSINKPTLEENLVFLGFGIDLDTYRDITFEILFLLMITDFGQHAKEAFFK